MKLECNLTDYRVPPEKRIKLSDYPTHVSPLSKSKKDYRKMLGDYRKEIKDFQEILYAYNRYALLLIFQGMDTAGKDGAIKHVMSGVNPQGCQVFSFKQPSSEELSHDYLWRTNKCLPERGRIGIFNRSYYEEVSIVRVYPEVLAKQQLPPECVDNKNIWKERFQDINNLEEYLHRNGTRVVKFFLHLSKEEQRQRFLARIDVAKKNWKMTRADIEVRGKWDAFQEAFGDAIGATSTHVAPWYIIPADDKRNARLLISQVILQTLASLKMSYPKSAPGHRKELEAVKLMLEKEK